MEPGEESTGSLLNTQRLSPCMQMCVQYGLAEVITRARAETEAQGVMDPFGVARALYRARFTLFEPGEWESERDVMEGYVLDGILKVAWQSAGPGRSPQLCLVASQDLPSGAKLVAARGVLEPVDPRRGPSKAKQTWELSGASGYPASFELSQQELRYANISRYCMRTREMQQPANVAMEWERVFHSGWECGVGILTVLGATIHAGKILYAL